MFGAKSGIGNGGNILMIISTAPVKHMRLDINKQLRVAGFHHGGDKDVEGIDGWMWAEFFS